MAGMTPRQRTRLGTVPNPSSNCLTDKRGTRYCYSNLFLLEEVFNFLSVCF